MVAFEEAIAELGPALARVAAGFERDRALREDLLQDILLALFRALPGLEDRAKLKAFAFRVAHNRAVDHMVRYAASPRATEISSELASGDASPEETLLADERSKRLLDAVRSLELALQAGDHAGAGGHELCGDRRGARHFPRQCGRAGEPRENQAEGVARS